MTPTPDLCDRFGDRVTVAEPLFRDFGGRPAFAGEIETVRVFEDNALVRHVLEGEGAGPGAGGGRRRVATLRAGRWPAGRGWRRSNGWSGIVVNGCVRDVGEIAVAAVGVKALAACPKPPSKTGAGERGVPVSFAGVTFTPGHLDLGRRGRPGGRRPRAFGGLKRRQDAKTKRPADDRRAVWSSSGRSPPEYTKTSRCAPLHPSSTYHRFG